MVRAEIVVNSHINDSKFEFENEISQDIAQKRLSFIQRLISRMDGDLNNEVTDEELNFQWNTLDQDPYEARLAFEDEFGYYYPKDKKKS